MNIQDKAGAAARTEAELTLDGKMTSMPVRQGTLGPDVIDVGSSIAILAALPTTRASRRRPTASSRITYIDGDKGVLLYRGYPIDQLAEQSNFLETCYLLLHGELPTKPRV